jgi:hypothetical protein
MQNHEPKKKVKKLKAKILLVKQIFFLASYPSATWLHVGAPHKILEN